MKILIISNGSITDYNFYNNIIKRVDFIICADGGAKHLKKIGIIPNIIVGDLDSIDEKDINYYKSKDVEFLKFPVNKDATDTELATEVALSLHPTDIIYIGTLGSRMDHTLANIFLLVKLLNLNIKGKIINENNEIFIIKNEIEISGSRDEFLSIIPITNFVRGITLSGLEYPLNNANIKLGSSIGISNQFKNDIARIKIQEGLLIVIKSKD